MYTFTDLEITYSCIKLYASLFVHLFFSQQHPPLSAAAFRHDHPFVFIFESDNPCIIQVEDGYGVQFSGDTASPRCLLWVFHVD